jgi:hypothetical protein
MDIIKARFEEVEVDKELAIAYRKVFNGSAESCLVLDDLMNHCTFGKYSDDTVIKVRILERSSIIWRILLMLNGNPTKPDQTDTEGE